MRPLTTQFSAAIAALIAAASACAQQTWTVALQPGPGVDFTDIAAAVAAAAPGDRIQVYGTTSSTPTYAPFVVDKALDVEAIDAALVRWLRVENLPAGQTVRIAGFRCQPTPTYQTQDECLLIRDCHGTVLLTDLEVRNLTGDHMEGFVLRDADVVVLQDVTWIGRSGGLNSGGPALVTLRSGCSMVRTTLTGGYGGSSASSAAGFDGGPGLTIDAGSVLAADCVIAGGTGGLGFFFCGEGGTAVVNLSTPAGVATLLGCTITRGIGMPGCSSDGDAVDGLVRIASDCTVTGALQNGAVYVPPVTLLQATADAMLGSNLDLTLVGSAGTFFCVVVASGGAHQLMPGFAEPVLVAANWLPLASGNLSGTTTALSWPVPNLPQLSGLLLWFQAAAVEISGRATLTPLAVSRLGS